MEGMYGDIEVLEAREAKEIEEFNRRNNMNNSYSQSLRVKKLQQTSQRKKSSNTKGPDSSGPSSETALAGHITNNNNNTSSSSTIVTTAADATQQTDNAQNPQKYVQVYNLKESPLIEFVFRKDPRENSVPRLYRECLKVSQEITIGHLKRFLGKKVAYNPWNDFQITVNAGGRQVVLDDSIQLGKVRTEICDYHEGMMLVLQYFVQRFVLDTECNHDGDDGDGDGDDGGDGGNKNSNGVILGISDSEK